MRIVRPFDILVLDMQRNKAEEATRLTLAAIEADNTADAWFFAKRAATLWRKYDFAVCAYERAQRWLRKAA